MRDTRARLADILEAVAAIRRHAARGREVFAGDELVQVWIVHHLPIIGEAAARLDPDLRRMSRAPWAGIVGMRIILVHRYFGIDLDAVWRVVERDLDPRGGGAAPAGRSPSGPIARGTSGPRSATS